MRRFSPNLNKPRSILTHGENPKNKSFLELFSNSSETAIAVVVKALQPILNLDHHNDISPATMIHWSSPILFWLRAGIPTTGHSWNYFWTRVKQQLELFFTVTFPQPPRSADRAIQIRLPSSDVQHFRGFPTSLRLSVLLSNTILCYSSWSNMIMKPKTDEFGGATITIIKNVTFPQIEPWT